MPDHPVKRLSLVERRKKTNELLKRQGLGLEKVSKQYLKQLKHTNAVAFNNLAVKKFIELVRAMIEANGGRGVSLLRIYQEAAYEIGISIETAKRYMLAHTARRAEFFMFGENVHLNADYVAPAEEGQEEGGSDE